MQHSRILTTAVALLLTAGVSAAFAQDAAPMMKKKHVVTGYRPLTVGGKARPVARPVGPVDAAVGVGAGVGAAVAAPLAAIPLVGGVGGVVAAPFAGLTGGPVGISGDVAPPLPIKARYANTGAVSTTYDEGYSQDVPVDKSGPIYQIDNGGHDRGVTPFTLLAFPITATTSIVTSPLRPVVPHT